MSEIKFVGFYTRHGGRYGAVEQDGVRYGFTRQRIEEVGGGAEFAADLEHWYPKGLEAAGFVPQQEKEIEDNVWENDDEQA